MTYLKEEFSFRKTNQFSELINNYQEQSPAISQYISGFPTIENFKLQIQKKANAKCDRNTLVEVLLNQYVDIAENETTISQIKLLSNSNTFTVTTGHQCCLFTGPLYFIYKIISTINLAKKLNSEIPENKFVPIFWMATEDHDFEEINHINLLGKKISIESEEVGNAVGRIELHKIENAISEIEELVKNFEFGAEAIQQLKQCYQNGKSIADATRTFVHLLFKNDGLVIIDADNEKLKNQFKQVFYSDLINNKNQELVNQVTNELINNKVLDKSQISPRSVNSFLLFEKKRIRIDKNDNQYSLKDSVHKFSEQQLIDLIESSPQSFSPNVVLRPLYQESILPNLAYIGGGAEVSYWLQLKNVFEKNDVLFPILLLRNSVEFIEKNQLDKFLALGFTIADIFKDNQSLQKQFLANNVAEIKFENESNKVQQAFSSIEGQAIKIDKTLKDSVGSELAKALSSIKNIEQKIAKAQKRKEETSLSQIEKFAQKYFPNNGLQERNDNFLYFYTKYGHTFIEILKSELNPLNNSFLVILID